MRFIVIAAAAALCLSGAAHADGNGARYAEDAAVAADGCTWRSDHDAIGTAVERAVKEAYADSADYDPEMVSRINERVQAAMDRVQQRLERLQDVRRQAHEAEMDAIERRVDAAMERLEQAIERQIEARAQLTDVDEARIDAEIERAVIRAQAALDRAGVRYQRRQTPELMGGASGGVL